MSSNERDLKRATVLSGIFHIAILLIGILGFPKPANRQELFVSVEIAGASETEQEFNECKNEVAQQVEKSKDYSQRFEENEAIDTGPMDAPERSTPKVEEASPQEEEKVLEEAPHEEVVHSLSQEAPQEVDLSVDEEALRLEEERLKREQEERKRQEMQKIQQEKIERKKKAEELKKRKELEVLKRIEKKKERKKKRLAKINSELKKSAAKDKKDRDFADMLKSERKNLSKSKSADLQMHGNSGFGSGNGLGSYGNGNGFTESDAAIISSQVAPHWIVAGGVKNAEALTIRVHIKLKENGEVIPSSVEILDTDRYNSDEVFRSAADSAKRAILEASPFRVPRHKMHLFRDFEFSFNTDRALGGRK